MLKVGYIGLGLMGKSIARNILKAGFPLVVHNRSRAAVDELVAEGAVAANSPKEVAAQVDVVFTNLPDTPMWSRLSWAKTASSKARTRDWSTWTTPPSSPPRPAGSLKSCPLRERLRWMPRSRAETSAPGTAR
jgi:hypothetical protein